MLLRTCILSETIVVLQRVKTGPWEECVKNFRWFMALKIALAREHACGVSVVLNFIMGPKGQNI